MNNDIDLRRLVELLSYLKKSDDVEQELDKDEPKEAPPGHAAGRRKHAAFTDPKLMAQHAKLGSPGEEFDSRKLQEQFRSKTSVGSGTPGSPGTTSGNIPDVSSETPEGTEDSEGIIEPYKDYTPEGDEIGPRQGRFRRLGDTPIESVTAPEPTGSDTSDSPSLDFPTDEEREIIQWFKDEGYTLSELKQMIEDYTKPASSKRKETPIHHVIRSDSNDRISKSNESILLTLLDKFLYLKNDRITR